MFKKKQAAPTSPTFSRTDHQPVRPCAELDAVLHFAGDCAGEPIWNATGCRFDNGTVLVRTSPVNRFGLYVHVGREWHRLMTIEPGDPAISELQEAGALTMYGPSPAEQESQQRRDAARRAIIEDAQIVANQRAWAAAARKKLAEAMRNGEPRKVAARRLGLA